MELQILSGSKVAHKYGRAKRWPQDILVGSTSGRLTVAVV